MKFSCLQENLKDGLGIVSKAVATKGSLPVLSHVLLVTEDDGRVRLAATNLETSIVTWIKAQVDIPGGITVPARLLQEFINNLPPTELTANLENQVLHLSTPSGKSKFNGLTRDEFPSLPELQGSSSLTIDPKIFAKAVSEVAFAASIDETRPVLNGVMLSTDGTDLVLVGIDGFRLAESRLPLPSSIAIESVIIPAKTLWEVARLVSALTTPVKISIQKEGNLVAFEAENFLILSRLLEGEFPDYKRIIPSETKTRSVFNREDFLKAVRLSSIFAKDSSNIIKMLLDTGTSELVLSATTAEIGENVTRVPAEISGESLDIAFNGKYLLDLLNNTVSEKLVLQTMGSLNPGLWHLDDRSDYLHLIMPVRVTG